MTSNYGLQLYFTLNTWVTQNFSHNFKSHGVFSSSIKICTLTLVFYLYRIVNFLGRKQCNRKFRFHKIEENIVLALCQVIPEKSNFRARVFQPWLSVSSSFRDKVLSIMSFLSNHKKYDIKKWFILISMIMLIQ